MYNQINWLASYPKSGNTWLRAFLQAYFTHDLDINRLNISIQDDAGGAYQLGTSNVDIVAAPVDIQQLMRPAALLRTVATYNEHGADVPLFVKTHTPHMLANGIELLPYQLTKSVAYLVRDPRDVLPSFAKHMGVDLDTALTYMSDRYRTLSPVVGRVADFLSRWDSHVLSYLNADSHNVRWWRFEDMRESPAEVFSEILSHFGVTPDSGVVGMAVELCALDNLKAQEAETGFKEASPHTDKFFGQGKVGGYQNKLEPRHIYRIEKEFGRTMKRLGYKTTRRAA